MITSESTASRPQAVAPLLPAPIHHDNGRVRIFIRLPARRFLSQLSGNYLLLWSDVPERSEIIREIAGIQYLDTGMMLPVKSSDGTGLRRWRESDFPAFAALNSGWYIRPKMTSSIRWCHWGIP